LWKDQAILCQLAGISKVGVTCPPKTDPSKPDGKQVINTKIIINAVEGGKQKSKILLNGKPLEKREDTVSK